MADQPMTEGECMVTIDLIRSVATVALAVPFEDLRRLIRRAEREDTLGPVLNPTGWIATHRKADAIRAAAAALVAFKATLEEIGFEVES